MSQRIPVVVQSPGVGRRGSVRLPVRKNSGFMRVAVCGGPRCFRLRGVPLGNTIRHTMKTLTVKIPESLDARLRSKAKAGNEPVSALVRRALIRDLEADAADFAKLAEPYRGMFAGPADLSEREGYGNQKPR